MTVDFPEQHVMRMRLPHSPRTAGMAVTIEPDPLGPVNSILSLVRQESDGTRTKIRSALAPVRAGTTVQLGFGPMESQLEDIAHGPLTLSVPCYWIAVNGRRVMQVPEHETWPAFPTPKSPWHRRARHTLSCRLRTAADAAAGRLGYHRDGQCEGDGW